LRPKGCEEGGSNITPVVIIMKIKILFEATSTIHVQPLTAYDIFQKKYDIRMTCPMTARVETTIFSTRSLNVIPGAHTKRREGRFGAKLTQPKSVYLNAPKA
jgi:hypothetical protein